MDWLDYREKLGIGFDDEQKIDFFIHKIFNILGLIAESEEIVEKHEKELKNERRNQNDGK